MIAFEQVTAWIDAGEMGELLDALSTAGEAERRALARPLKAFASEWWSSTGLVPGRPSPRLLRREGAFRLAGAACLPRAADVVTWLRSDRAWFVPSPESLTALVHALGLPGRPSTAAVATGLATRMRPDDTVRQWPIARALLDASGTEPPATEATLTGWMREVRFTDWLREERLPAGWPQEDPPPAGWPSSGWPSSGWPSSGWPQEDPPPAGWPAERRSGAGRARDDDGDDVLPDVVWPPTDRLVGWFLAHLFEVPRVCGELRDDGPAVLARLCADRIADRAAMLDGCLFRLRAGDRPSALRPVVALHRLLEPTAGECAARRPEYLGLLTAAHSPTVELAVQALRHADGDGPPDVDTVADAAHTMLLRPEKKLFRAQLAWHQAALAAKPEPPLFASLLSGLANESPDLAEQALKLAARHLPSFGPEGRDLLEQAAADLTGDLRRQARSALAAPTGVPGPGPSPHAPALASDPSAATVPSAATDPSVATDSFVVTDRSAAIDLSAVTDPFAVTDLSRGEPGAVVDPSRGQPASAPSRGQPASAFGPSTHERPAAAPMPAPIGSLAELSAEVGVLMNTEADDPVRWELILDGLIRFGRADRTALAEAMRRHTRDWDSPVVNMLRATVTGAWSPWVPNRWEKQLPGPFWMTVARAAEIGRQFATELPLTLLATPATVDGHVDPDRVCALLAEFEEAGRQPGPHDLSQALLRLPRASTPGGPPTSATGSTTATAGPGSCAAEPSTLAAGPSAPTAGPGRFAVGPGTLAAAGRLRSPAGRAFAAYLNDGGLPDPDIITVVAGSRPCAQARQCRDGELHCYCAQQPNRRRSVTFDPIAHPSLAVPETLLALPVTDVYNRAYGAHRDAPMGYWPMMFPGHREIVAGHAQALLAPAADGNLANQLDILPVLARNDGPFGPAMALCLAYGLAAGRPAGRIATADAFLTLAGSDRTRLDRTAEHQSGPDHLGHVGRDHLGHVGRDHLALVGRELALLHTAKMIVLKRVVDGLATIVRAGAAGPAWSVIRELLPAVLSDPRPAAGAPDLLMLAESAAAAAGVRETLPEVAAVAARTGKSRLTAEAARLQRTLTGTQSADEP
jgi:hypothetical protein